MALLSPVIPGMPFFSENRHKIRPGTLFIPVDSPLPPHVSFQSITDAHAFRMFFRPTTLFTPQSFFFFFDRPFTIGPNTPSEALKLFSY